MKINVNMKQIGSRKNVVAPQPFELPDKPATVGELIVMTTGICVDEYNEKGFCKNVLHGIVENIKETIPMTDEQINSMSAIGRFVFGINYSGKTQDKDAAVKNALQCYEDGLFRIFINDEEAGEVNESINLSENDTLTFIRLTMLAGRMW